MTTITLDISDEMMQRLQSQNQPLQSLLIEALNVYLDRKSLTKSKTWELCGSFEVTGSQSHEWEAESGEKFTNYAENLDRDLY